MGFLYLNLFGGNLKLQFETFVICVVAGASLAALALYLVTYFQTVAAKGISATVMYPVVNGLTLVAGTLMSVFFFGEKLKRESIAGIVLVFIAMIL